MIEAIQKRVRYIRPRYATFTDWYKTIYPCNRSSAPQKIHLRNGAVFTVRNTKDSTRDIAILLSMFKEDEYLLKNLSLPESPTILDLGANIGAFSRLCLLQFPKAKISAYEPDPSNYKLLLLNCPEVDSHGVAVTSTDGTARMYFGEYPQSTTLVRGNVHEKIQNPESVEIPTQSLASIVKGHVDLVKMDVEGSEYDIFFNTPDEVFAAIDNLIIEIHSSHDQWTDQDLVARIEHLGFTLKNKDTVLYWFKRETL